MTGIGVIFTFIEITESLTSIFIY